MYVDIIIQTNGDGIMCVLFSSITITFTVYDYWKSTEGVENLVYVK